VLEQAITATAASRTQARRYLHANTVHTIVGDITFAPTAMDAIAHAAGHIEPARNGWRNSRIWDNQVILTPAQFRPARSSIDAKARQ